MSTQVKNLSAAVKKSTMLKNIMSRLSKWNHYVLRIVWIAAFFGFWRGKNRGNAKEVSTRRIFLGETNIMTEQVEKGTGTVEDLFLWN